MSVVRSVCFLALGILIISLLCIAIQNRLTVESVNDKENLHQYSRQHVSSLGQEDDDVLVFVHISDLHISAFTAKDRYQQLSEFCNINLKAINPGLVLASGDLTDSVAPDNLVVDQFIEEWSMYKVLYTECQNVSRVPHWLDLRGNHDNFNINGYNSSNNYYPKFGSQRFHTSGSYMTTIEINDKTKYAFIAVDATLDIGSKRLLNFVGQLDDTRLLKLQELDQAASKLNVNATIWFGHYPSSIILTYGILPGLRHIAAKGIAYLCGHLHNFGGMIPHMYSNHHSGMLELELADWKHNRMYRVAVLDQGLFSFTDIQHKTWPVIVVTNPKPLLTVQPSKEPIELMATSTHIRIYIFSPSPINSCEIKLDEGSWQPCKRSGQQHPLYTAPWQPELYSKGLHVLHVRASDSSGSEVLTKIEFALDDTKPRFPLSARLALMLDFTAVSKVIFAVSIIWCILPFCILRHLQLRIIQRKMTALRIRTSWIRLWVRKFWIFASINSLLFPYLAYTVYLAFGPWFMAHFVADRIGVLFVWGTLFEDGTYLPGTTTYFYCAMHVIFFNMLFVTILAHTADVRYQEKILKKRTDSHTMCRKITSNFPISIFLIVHGITCLIFWQSYGYLSMLVNPARSWNLILAFYLWFTAKRLDTPQLTNAVKTWN
ncbi:transmembrane protein 62-like isoform X2 [Daphnia carinata]|uniref:transmembrane protein 62-like isoform X2 n=1 Tax=Daphnia carinata TaxID=120202 RepID=UPI00257FA1F8|nr:transmembrane protein 62-like isoform X2 [Daphnia carinata]